MATSIRITSYSDIPVDLCLPTGVSELGYERMRSDKASDNFQAVTDFKNLENFPNSQVVNHLYQVTSTVSAIADIPVTPTFIAMSLTALRESSFREEAKNASGHKGLFQIGETIRRNLLKHYGLTYIRPASLSSLYYFDLAVALFKHLNVRSSKDLVRILDQAFGNMYGSVVPSITALAPWALRLWTIVSAARAGFDPSSWPRFRWDIICRVPFCMPLLFTWR